MTSETYAVYKFPVGFLKLACRDGKLTRIERTDEPPREAADALLQKTKTELDEYFAGKRKTFDVPLQMEGTDFQKKVWAALCEIPYGETRTYGELAARVGAPKAFRAVGGANHRNPISIIVPCHRVVGADGSLTGYGGGLPMKEYLINLERENC